MKSRVTILAAVFLLAALAMPQLTEAQGFAVSKASGIDKVIASGNNQLLPTVKLAYAIVADPELPLQQRITEDLILTFGFGGLPITNATVWYHSVPDVLFEAITNVDLLDPDVGGTDTADLQWKWSSGDKTIQVLIKAGIQLDPDSEITINDLRVDVSDVDAGIDAGDHVPITISTDAEADFVSLGATSQEISSTIVMAAAGLTVAGTKAEGLSCGTVAGATVEVTEGFAGAWSKMNEGRVAYDSVASDSLHLRIEVSGFPDVEGAKITWPETVTHKATVADEENTIIATLTLDKEDSHGNGRVVIYEYSQVDTDTAIDDIQPHLADTARSFSVTISGVTNLGAADLNVSAQLWPEARRNSDGKKNAADLSKTLSFEHALEDPIFKGDQRDGAWLIVSDCITYLLYPFVTCQTAANSEWTTGISVSNTSRDAGLFGTFDRTEEQSGSVTFYGFPKSVATVSGSGRVPEPVVSMLRSNLAAGDTYTFTCSDSVMAGMEGYAIIKANFQHARGMAFVVANTDSVGGLDVAHGYMAEVIDDPTKRTDALME